MELNPSALATILCALRLLQEEAEKMAGCTEENGFPLPDPDEFRQAIRNLDHDSEHFADCLPLSYEEIDDLCERLNFE